MSDNAITLDKIWTMLMPQETLRRDFINSDQVLVHYTRTPLEILQSRQIWLSNVRDMNDQHEIRLGRECVDEFLQKKAGVLSEALNSIHQDLYSDLIMLWNQEYEAQINHTHIACFTSQYPTDNRGSSFHWQEYGKTALCLNTEFLQEEPSILALYLEKVTYGRPAVMAGLDRLLNVLQNNQAELADYAQSGGKDIIGSFLRHILFFASVTSKAENFATECEWRLIYSPYLFSSAHLEAKEVISKSGESRTVEILPLSTPLGTQNISLEMDRLIAKVMVHPQLIAEASDFALRIAQQLMYSGVVEPQRRVTVVDPE